MRPCPTHPTAKYQVSGVSATQHIQQASIASIFDINILSFYYFKLLT